MNFPSFGGKNSGVDSKLFISLGDGDKVTGVLRGDPKPFFQHWVGGRTVKCVGKRAGCEYCASEDEDVKKCSFRFKINMIVREDGIWVAKILEQGAKVYQALKDLNDGGYELESTVLTVSRTGTKTKTNYAVIPSPQKLTPADLKKVAAIPLNPLDEQKEEAPAESQIEEEINETEDDLPF